MESCRAKQCMVQSFSLFIIHWHLSQVMLLPLARGVVAITTAHLQSKKSKLRFLYWRCILVEMVLRAYFRKIKRLVIERFCKRCLFLKGIIFLNLNQTCQNSLQLWEIRPRPTLLHYPGVHLWKWRALSKNNLIQFFSFR